MHMMSTRRRCRSWIESDGPVSLACILTYVHQRINTKCARQMVVDSINQATWQVITDQAAHSDTRPHRSFRILWWQKMLVMLPGIFPVRIYRREFPLNRHNVAELSFENGTRGIRLRFGSGFCAISDICLFPFVSFCNWRFALPVGLSFVMVIQSMRRVLFVWQINVWLPDKMWKRSWQ